MRSPWRLEAGALTALALPMIAGNIAWAGIAATDLLLLGRLGAGAVASGALAINLFNALLIFGMGLVTAAAPLIATERGRRRHSVRDVRRTVHQTLRAATLFVLPAWALLWESESILLLMGQEADLAAQAGELMRGLQWALLPFLGFTTLRNFISALERPVWGLIIMVCAIPFNLLAGWTLIFGHLGFPALGIFGAGIASTLSSSFLFLGLLSVILIDRRFRRYRLLGRFWTRDRERHRAVWALGLPIAITLGLETTVFNASAFLMGLIDRDSLAAHAVAIQIAALVFMVPMGIGQAATVRVGLAYGKGDLAAVGRAGWLALAIGTGFALIAATMLIAFPRMLISAFLNLADPANARTAMLAVGFLGVAALFQLVDAAQAVGAGVLRGIQDTRVPMIFALIGYWVIGIGIGIVLAFPLGLQGLGIWLGLASGLGVVALLLVARWALRERLHLLSRRRNA
ncbi:MULTISPECIES: MATE family efflux transporter [Sphingobium]|jgi:MATE family multidrug resistance protein|uniref:MATE family efflux transporter n=1 Tax=Sphingobium fuliginis (strain ATCC 27551) TaxID=336203 RepID=A0A292ZE07_SPHSA|nr:MULTISPECIES: MATE family efflux transporter [Sphingobium]OAP32832.1 MATE family efflux transporter [Sphingobium sp. 20006FA]KXU32448.1 MATE family efflux transporter [Sphingobium sp. AM]KYC32506.1 MATE family efflux transporter [Sphingobium sp. 22B]MCB4861804.1 MATE family efflux transporter [Sphingobium sp. PNB]QOT72886.1 MATE family efflux transporter [Sphingobium fuliginis]